MPDSGQAGGVQLPILGGPIVDLLLERQFGGRKSDERARFVDQLTVGLAIRIAADLPALGRSGRFIDVPLHERGRVENVLMAPANEDDWTIRRNGIEIAA